MAINIGFDKYVRWPFKFKAILWSGIAIAIGTAYYFLSLAPQLEEIRKLEQESSQLAGQIVEKKAIADNLETVKADVVKMDNLLSQALEKLPSAEEIPKLLKTVADLAKDTALESLLFKPGGATPAPPDYFYASIPLDMEQTGSFYDLAKFFDKVSRLPRIVTIESITVSSLDPARQPSPLLKAGFKAVTFKYLTPGERPAKPEPGKDGGKGKPAKAPAAPPKE